VKISIIVGIILLLIFTTSYAQIDQSKARSSIIIIKNDGVILKGKFIKLKNDNLTYKPKLLKKYYEISISEIDYVKLPIKTYWLEGAMMGAAAGGIGGLIYEVFSSEKTPYRDGYITKTRESSGEIDLKNVLIPAGTFGLIGLLLGYGRVDYDEIQLDGKTSITINEEMNFKNQYVSFKVNFKF